MKSFCISHHATYITPCAESDERQKQWRACDHAQLAAQGREREGMTGKQGEKGQTGPRRSLLNIEESLEIWTSLII